MDEVNEVMYVTCILGNKVVKVTLDGKLISSVGSRGSDHLQFNTPLGLCLDAASNLYVADYGNQRVLVLGPDLLFKKEFKCQSGSRGVAIDSLGTLHVVTDSGLESFVNNLQSFYQERHSCHDIAISPEGFKFVTYSGTNGAGLEIRNPSGDLIKTVCAPRDHNKQAARPAYGWASVASPLPNDAPFQVCTQNRTSGSAVKQFCGGRESDPDSGQGFVCSRSME